MDLRNLTLADLQPSQFYISAGKLAAVESWLTPQSVPHMDPLPVKLLDGRPVLTDGHTRCVAARRQGIRHLPLIEDTDDLDWDCYRACVEECIRRGVHSPEALTGRILSDSDYERLWLGWCREMQKNISIRKTTE